MRAMMIMCLTVTILYNKFCEESP